MGPVPSWVTTVLLTRSSAAWQPEPGLVRGKCAAGLAPAMRAAFPHGCQRGSGHDGDHTPFAGVGKVMAREDDEKEHGAWPCGDGDDLWVSVL